MAKPESDSSDAKVWHSLLEYRDGCVYWKEDVSNRVKKGAQAGTKSKGRHSRICMKGKEYKVHRIIYTMHHGSIPDGLHIDHINRDFTDNRIENLRAVTAETNRQNSLGKGIYKLPSGKWASHIGVRYKRKYLGTFGTEAEAQNAYLQAKKLMHGVRS